MHDVVSLALFRHERSSYEHPNAGEGRGRFFTNCLPAILRGFAACFHGWIVRIHHDDSIYQTYYGDVLFDLASRAEIELVDCGKAETLCGSMLWRLKPASDPKVGRFLCRDIDAMPSPREAEAVREWVKSGMAVHAIHDSESHTGYMGGMMGFRSDALRDAFGADVYGEAIRFAKDVGLDLNTHGDDQRVLNRMFQPRLASSTFCSFDPKKLPHSQFRVAAAIPERSSPLDKAASHIGGCFDRVGAVGVYNDVARENGVVFADIAGIVEAERELSLDEQAYGNPPPNRYVVTSANLNHDYAFYVPIIAAMWMRLGYRPIVFLVGSSEEWKAHPFGSIALREARSRGAVIHFTKRVDGYAESTVAQTVRLAGGCVPFVRDDDYVLTTDVDMLPLSREFWSKPLEGGAKVDILFANAYEGERRPHWPICYIGMSRVSWEHLLGTYPNHDEAVWSWLNGNLDKEAVAKDAMVGWCFDEYFVSQRIAEASSSKEWKIRAVDRVKAGAGWPASRIDRGAWGETFSACTGYNGDALAIKADAVDCHAPRPGYGDVAWRERVRPLLDAFHPGLGASFDVYREKFQAAT